MCCELQYVIYSLLTPPLQLNAQSHFRDLPASRQPERKVLQQKMLLLAYDHARLCEFLRDSSVLSTITQPFTIIALLINNNFYCAMTTFYQKFLKYIFRVDHDIAILVWFNSRHPGYERNLDFRFNIFLLLPKNVPHLLPARQYRLPAATMQIFLVENKTCRIANKNSTFEALQNADKLIDKNTIFLACEARSTNHFSVHLLSSYLNMNPKSRNEPQIS